MSNSFGALTEDAVHSVADVETELTGWAHSVNKQSVNKNRKKGWMIKTKEDVDKISEIMGGRKSKNPERTIARLNDEAMIDELASLIEKKGSSLDSTTRKSKKVWAMVDSGSFVTIANCAKAFGKRYKISPSPGSIAGVKYANASGGEIKNRGQTVVVHHLPDGSTLNIPFQDADVQCPIISVKDFVKVGSIVKFKNSGGIIKLPDKRTLPFLERHGVYYILLDLGDDFGDDVTDNVDLDETNDGMLCGLCTDGLPDFHRPAP